jgi:hypothetical protein
MQKNKTYFEQVPLDAIKKIVDEDCCRRSKVETPADSKAEALEEEILLTTANYRTEARP